MRMFAISIAIFIFSVLAGLLWYRGVFVPFTPVPDIAITVSSGAIAFLEKAKEQIGIVKTYDHSNGYYSSGGFPPPDTGVCSDVIWRAYRDMGMDFKKLFQEDIKKNPVSYSGDMDSNINFRRVKRLFVYFSHTAIPLTNEMTPDDTKNLIEWQPGDIIVFEELPSNHLWHIGIIADKRTTHGVPYMLDNHGQGVNISITPLDWPTKIIGHFRVF